MATPTSIASASSAPACSSVNADLQKLADDGTVAELAEKYEIADMVTLKASDDASTEDSKDATDDAETDKTEEK